MSDQTSTDPAQTQEGADLPSWARESLSKANNEAARYRVERNQFENQLTEALGQVSTLTDAKTAAENAAAEAQRELLKLKVALAANVPGEHAAEFASRLRGDTEDELKADAENALKLFGNGRKPARATDPSQGRGGKASVPNTPQAEFAQLFGQLDIFKR